MDKAIEYARALRKQMTDAERRLCYYLRGHRLQGLKFRRQHPVPPYIADFCAEKILLIVELDGGGHNEGATRRYDEKRTAYLQARGYTVVRFWNTDVMQNIEVVLGEIVRVATILCTKTPSPPAPLP